DLPGHLLADAGARPGYNTCSLTVVGPRHTRPKVSTLSPRSNQLLRALLVVPRLEQSSDVSCAVQHPNNSHLLSTDSVKDDVSIDGPASQAGCEFIPLAPLLGHRRQVFASSR